MCSCSTAPRSTDPCRHVPLKPPPETRGIQNENAETELSWIWIQAKATGRPAAGVVQPCNPCCETVSSCRRTSANRSRACTTSSATTQTVPQSRRITHYSKERGPQNRRVRFRPTQHQLHTTVRPVQSLLVWSCFSKRLNLILSLLHTCFLCK